MRGPGGLGAISVSHNSSRIDSSLSFGGRGLGNCISHLLLRPDASWSLLHLWSLRSSSLAIHLRSLSSHICLRRRLDVLNRSRISLLRADLSLLDPASRSPGRTFSLTSLLVRLLIRLLLDKRSFHRQLAQSDLDAEALTLALVVLELQDLGRLLNASELVPHGAAHPDSSADRETVSVQLGRQTRVQPVEEVAHALVDVTLLARNPHDAIVSLLNLSPGLVLFGVCTFISCRKGVKLDRRSDKHWCLVCTCRGSVDCHLDENILSRCQSGSCFFFKSAHRKVCLVC